MKYLLLIILNVIAVGQIVQSVKIADGQKCRRSNLPSVKNAVCQNGRRSKIPSVKMAFGQKFRRSKWPSVKIVVGQNCRRSKWPSVKAASVKRPGTSKNILYLPHFMQFLTTKTKTNLEASNLETRKKTSPIIHDLCKNLYKFICILIFHIHLKEMHTLSFPADNFYQTIAVAQNTVLRNTKFEAQLQMSEIIVHVRIAYKI
jgi:hypothetical protein